MGCEAVGAGQRPITINRIYIMKQTIALTAFLSLAFTLAADDWPNWRGPQHDGISREAMPKADFSKIAWRAEIGVGFSGMAVADGRLFAMGCTGKRRGNQETFTCLDAVTGKVNWSDTYPAALVDYLHEGGPCATPTVDGNRVYGFSKSGQLACYNVADGEKHWTVDLMAKAGLPKPPEWGFAGSPLVLGNMVVVEATFTCAFNKTTGKEIWRSKKYKPAYGIKPAQSTANFICRVCPGHCPFAGNLTVWHHHCCGTFQ